MHLITVLFESTSDEYLEAMGWASFNLTWAWFLPVIVCGALPLLRLPRLT